MGVTDDVRDACLAHVGRQRSQHDTMPPEPAEKLSVILGTKRPDRLPTTWHWAYFTTALRLEDTGHDGHERLGLFMPPVPFSRRMWAAGSLEVLTPLQIGIPADRVSTVTDVAFKDGRSGPLCFVEVEHVMSQGGSVAVRETQTIVYRDRVLTDERSKLYSDAPPEGYRIFQDTELLAYSTVLQNGHRIHWDRDFCRDVEGYPGLVVHGPLLATLLADSMCNMDVPHRFRYRAKAPVFEGTPIKVSENAIIRADGVTAMEGFFEEL